MLRIAICDDDDNIIGKLDTLINELQHKINEEIDIDDFLSGETLIYELETNSTIYDIFLLDIMMEKMNGIEVGKYIRQNPIYSSIEIIYLSRPTKL